MRQTPRSRLLLDSFVALVTGTIVLLAGCGGGGGGNGGGTAGAGTGGLSSTAGLSIVEGRVISSSTGSGVSGATVQASGVTTTTLSDGSYLLENVPSGTVIAVASATGLVAGSQLVFLSAGALATVNFTLQSSSSSGGGGGGSSSSGTGPAIKSIIPANGTTDADVSSQIIITFDQSVLSSTLSTASVILTRITTPSSVDDSGCSTIIPFVGLANTFIYVPGGLDTSTVKTCPASTVTAKLAAKTKYVLTVNDRLHGTNGLPAPGSTKTFTTRDQGGGTGGGTSLNAPRLIFENPNNNQQNVDPGTEILFGFDSAVITSTVTVTNKNVIFSRLTPPASNDLSGNIIPVTTPVPLANTFQYIPGPGFMTVATTYSLFVTNKVIGQNGIPEKGESFSFGTRSQNSASTGPVVISRNPSAGQSNVATDTLIFLTFDRPLNPLSLTTGSAITLSETTPTVQTINTTLTLLTNPANTVQIHPVTASGITTNLDQKAFFQVNVTNRIQDQQGNPAKGDSYTFSTRVVSGSGGGAGGIVTPHLVSSNPSNNSTNVDVNTRVLLTFDVPMVLASLQQPNAIILSQITPPATDLNICVSPSALQNTFVVQAVVPGSSCSPSPVTRSLLGNDQYRLFLSNTIQASGGNGGFLNPTFVGFTTRQISGGCGDTGAPTLAGSNPSNNAQNVDINVSIIFSFNKPVQVSTVTTASVALTQFTTPASRDSAAPAPTPLDASVKPLACTSPTVNVTAASEFLYNEGSLKLTPGITFKVFLTNSILDLAGNHLVPANFAFTTANIQTIPQGPRLASSDPTNASTNNDPASIILFTFDKDIFLAGDDRPFDPLLYNTLPVTITPPPGIPNYPVLPAWTVNPTTTFLSRITIPSENDKTANITQTFTVISGRFSGAYTAHVGPVVFRPDPINFPRTFQYIPGKEALQAGLVRYSLFITDGVRDAQGNASPGATFGFTTRPAVNQPASGPRLLGSEPGTGQFVGIDARILLTFDKAVLPSSIQGGLGVDIADVAIPQNAGDCTKLLVCDPRTDDPIKCTCGTPLGAVNFCPPSGAGATAFCDVSLANGEPPETTWEFHHVTLTEGDTVYLTINGNVKSDGALLGDFEADGITPINLPAPGDVTFFFVR